MNEFRESVMEILMDCHSPGMTMLMVAIKHRIPLEEVMLLREKEEAGDLNDLIFMNAT